MTKILVVDDNPSVRAALRMCFKTKTDWIVCGEAENGYDAIELARRVKPDVVLLDYAMPVMNGLEAARTLSALAPECAILMYTGCLLLSGRVRTGFPLLAFALFFPKR